MKSLMTLGFFSMILNFAAMSYSQDITIKTYDCTDLYPSAEPFDEGYLQVSPLHTLYYAQFGNPDGVPILVVHGGPGMGCSPQLSAFFDLSFYRVIMFDQRGSGNSTPAAEMNENTPQLAIDDIEKLRNYLEVDRWLLFGGSYGSCLSILYGETHPDRCLGFILRGIFLGRDRDYSRIFYRMREFYPEAWDEMVQSLPKDDHYDLIYSLYKGVMNPDPKVHLPIAHAFMRYDMLCATLLPDPALVEKIALDDKLALSVARAFIYYSANHFFLNENQLMHDVKRIAHLPAIIVQGRYDMICIPQSAYDLHKSWSRSQLWFVSNGGHSTSDPAIAQGVLEATETMKTILDPTLSLKPTLCEGLNSQ